jgi:hypothetical protein
LKNSTCWSNLNTGEGLQHRVFKCLPEQLMNPLCLLYNTENANFPNIWKLTRICPILKLGESSKTENYSPIAIVCAPAKVLEQILYSRIFNHVKSYVSEGQHGFFSHRSTTTNLINSVQNVFNAFHNRTCIDAIYIYSARV